MSLPSPSNNNNKDNHQGNIHPPPQPPPSKFWHNLYTLIEETNVFEWLKDNGHPVWVVYPFAFSALSVMGISFLSRKIKSATFRYKTADDFTTDNFQRKDTISGVVLRCGDGDGFKLYHMPWYEYWKWKLFGDYESCYLPPLPPELGYLKEKPNGSPRTDNPRGSPFTLSGPKIPILSKSIQSNETISIRLAAVDAPECAHFGAPEQKWGPIVRTWLQNKLLGRRVFVDVLSRDQYGRILGYPWLPNGLFGRLNIPLYMVENGLAVVYHGHGAEYNGYEEVLLNSEEKSKKQIIGLWEDGGSTPMEFKKTHK